MVVIVRQMNKPVQWMFYTATNWGRKLSELALILGLPGIRQTQKLTSKLVDCEHYMPGLNDWAIEKASRHAKVPLQNGWYKSSTCY